MQQVLGDADKGGRFAHAAVDLLLAQAHVARAKGDVLVHRLLEKLVLRVLEHQPHLKADVPQLGFVLPHILPVDIDFAGGWFEQTVEVLDQRRFSRTGMADNADHLSFLNGEVDVLDGHFDKGCPLRIYMTQMLCLDDCHFLLTSFLSSCRQRRKVQLPSFLLNGMPSTRFAARPAVAGQLPFWA